MREIENIQCPVRGPLIGDCGGDRKFPKPELVYVSQIIILYIIIICSLVNLSLGSGENALWISLLSLCIGVRILFIISGLIYDTDLLNIFRIKILIIYRKIVINSSMNVI